MWQIQLEAECKTKVEELLLQKEEVRRQRARSSLLDNPELYLNNCCAKPCRSLRERFKAVEKSLVSWSGCSSKLPIVSNPRRKTWLCLSGSTRWR